MKKIVLVIFMALTVNVAISQNISDYVVSLNVPSGSKGAKANVTVDVKSSAALRTIRPVSDEKIQGFRVCIFFDNSQSARAAANATLTQLKTMYPAMPHYLVYTNPVWKVMAGDCISRAEATQLMGQLRHSFPKAFIVNESIPLNNFATTNEQQPINQPNTDVTEMDSINL